MIFLSVFFLFLFSLGEGNPPQTSNLFGVWRAGEATTSPNPTLPLFLCRLQHGTRDDEHAGISSTRGECSWKDGSLAKVKVKIVASTYCVAGCAKIEGVVDDITALLMEKNKEVAEMAKM